MAVSTGETLRAAYLWSRSSGLLARRSRVASLVLLPVALTLGWPTAAYCASRLVLAPGAVLLVADRPRRAAGPALVVALAYAAGVWGLLAALTTWLAVTVSPWWQLLLPAAALVAALDAGGEALVAPRRWWRGQRRLATLPAGTVVLASLAAWPRGGGAGTRLFASVCAASTVPLALTCRPALEGYYPRFGFVPDGAVMVRGSRLASLARSPAHDAGDPPTDPGHLRRGRRTPGAPRRTPRRTGSAVRRSAPARGRRRARA